ncbi:ROK family protein [Nocardia cerradoensis]|uniref:N-acetylglucosamine repressor n=1 Tax=Nocardia cerradoensis TaxID=85688 RepID=A0A231H4K4_9NOCA|nr:ROK family protein [Nocardia cerradoensis]NKY46573.1 ROK family protein [Nocardia cerradoensis]OXR43760.1 N-acetylglucosamine repressor [Nocardia cerradoensis]
MAVLAVDIGATKFAAAVAISPIGAVPGDESTAARPAALRHIHQVGVPPRDVWETCRELLRRVVGAASADEACGGADFEVTVVGIAAAGPVDVRTGSTAPLNIPEWRDGFPIVAAVRELFPAADIRFVIDGAALALAEYRVGGLRGVRSGLAMTVSSGIGGGIISDGRVVSGRTGNAGHVGHIVVPGWDVPCACGGAGCVEAVASGMSSVRWAREQGWPGTTGLDLARAAEAGDPIALAALSRAGTALGQAISSAAATLDIDRVVIGGGFAESGGPLWEPLRAAVARHARLGFIRELEILKSPITDGATLVGAAALASE